MHSRATGGHAAASGWLPEYAETSYPRLLHLNDSDGLGQSYTDCNDLHGTPGKANIYDRGMTYVTQETLPVGTTSSAVQSRHWSTHIPSLRHLPLLLR